MKSQYDEIPLYIRKRIEKWWNSLTPEDREIMSKRKRMPSKAVDKGYNRTGRKSPRGKK